MSAPARHTAAVSQLLLECWENLSVSSVINTIVPVFIFEKNQKNTDLVEHTDPAWSKQLGTDLEGNDTPNHSQAPRSARWWTSCKFYSETSKDGGYPRGTISNFLGH